jgi:hypothetical protein
MQACPHFDSGSVKWRGTENGGRRDEVLKWGLEELYRGRGKNKEAKGIFAMFFEENSGNNFIRG